MNTNTAYQLGEKEAIKVMVAKMVAERIGPVNTSLGFRDGQFLEKLPTLGSQDLDTARLKGFEDTFQDVQSITNTILSS